MNDTSSLCFQMPLMLYLRAPTSINSSSFGPHRPSETGYEINVMMSVVHCSRPGAPFAVETRLVPSFVTEIFVEDFAFLEHP